MRCLLIDIIIETDNTIIDMDKPKRDPNGSGREWIYRGITMNDQAGSGVSPAYRWEVPAQDGIHTCYFRHKVDAIAYIDKIKYEKA